MVKRIAGWGVVVLLLAGLCVLVFSSKQPTNSFRGADGHTISLIAVTYGTNSCVWGKPYQRTLYRILPRNLKSLSGVTTFAAAATGIRTNVPTFWFYESRTFVSPTNFKGGSHFFIRVLDEFGCECSPNASRSSSYFGVGRGDRISQQQVSAADPHGKICGVCVYDSAEKDKRLATFLIPGCVLDQLPAVRQPVAAPVKNGDLTFEMTSLLTSLKSEPFSYSTNTNGILYSEAAFHITKNGVPVPNWMPVNIKVVDAKGKRVTYQASSHGMRNGDKIYNFAADLNPAEGPFKLRVEFKHFSEYSPDELVTFKDVPFPADGQSLTPHMEMESHGQRVILDAIYSSTAEKPADFYQPGQPFIQARISPTTNSFNLQLAKVVDEKGAEIYAWAISVDKGVYRFNIDPAKKAKSMTLTFALHQSRFAEFEAMPVVFSTNRLAKN